MTIIIIFFFQVHLLLRDLRSFPTRRSSDLTIMDNIRYGRLDATDAEVIAAAEATFVDRFVRTLPEGYDTAIEEEGANISAGERQLITIARARSEERRVGKQRRYRGSADRNSGGQ